ncbi:hypothetical protein GALL_485210 [mine drainage metagenome]|uniref:Uncharacterized protein n=1 Tax=mine drainage metagenome TaxID=410659 RepID=A0A1J5PF83_9ZZZZ
MMPPGRRDFQRAFGAFLPFDLDHVAAELVGRNLARHGGGEHRLTGIMAHHLGERPCRQHLRRTNPRGLGPAGARAQQRAILGGGGHR